uniref:Uncharacterized protein n=1 Tax=Cyprinus carpio TaxID=7962 RepID=A0A8C2JNU6_CYPCA
MLFIFRCLYSIYFYLLILVIFSHSIRLIQYVYLICIVFRFSYFNTLFNYFSYLFYFRLQKLSVFLFSQDALLQLASVVDVSSLQTTFKDVLRVVLPNVECVFVYLLEAESRLRCEDPPHEVPPEGKLR